MSFTENEKFTTAKAAFHYFMYSVYPVFQHLENPMCMQERTHFIINEEHVLHTNL
jgi:hypothetical protein